MDQLVDKELTGHWNSCSQQLNVQVSSSGNGISQGLVLWLVLFNNFVRDTDSGIECTLSDTKLCSLTDTLEGGDAIQRDLDRLERWQFTKHNTQWSDGHAEVCTLPVFTVYEKAANEIELSNTVNYITLGLQRHLRFCKPTVFSFIKNSYMKQAENQIIFVILIKSVLNKLSKDTKRDNFYWCLL